MALKTIVAATAMATISSEDKPLFSGSLVVGLVLILFDVFVRIVDVLV